MAQSTSTMMDDNTDFQQPMYLIVSNKSDLFTVSSTWDSQSLNGERDEETARCAISEENTIPRADSGFFTENGKTHSEDLEEDFVPTEFYLRVLGHLEEYKQVIIQGPPKSGKTAIAYALLRHYSDQGYEPIVLTNCETDLSEVFRKQIILLDGAIGEVKVDRENLRKWADLINKMKVEPACLLVITLYEHIREEVERLTGMLSFINNIPLLDLTTAPEIQAEEKIKILECHLKKKDLLDHSTQVRLIMNKNNVGVAFPWFCSHYACDLAYKKLYNNRLPPDYGIFIFSNPSMAYVAFFVKVLTVEDTTVRDLFLLIMSGQGDVIKDKEQTENVLKDMNLDPVSAKEFPEKMSFFSGSVLSDVGHAFKSRDIYEAFGLALCKVDRLKFLLKYCDVQFLVQHVATEHIPKFPLLKMPPTSRYYYEFMNRLAGELMSGNVVQICQHPSLNNPRFLKDFERYCSEKEILQQVVFSRDKKHGMALLYWSCWLPSEHLTVWCLKNVKHHDEDCGRLVRRCLLVCCLRGEKMGRLRVSEMFLVLDKSSFVLQEPISSVRMAVPGVDDLLTDHFKMAYDQLKYSALVGPEPDASIGINQSKTSSTIEEDGRRSLPSENICQNISAAEKLNGSTPLMARKMMNPPTSSIISASSECDAEEGSRPKSTRPSELGSTGGLITVVKTTADGSESITEHGSRKIEIRNTNYVLKNHQAMSAETRPQSARRLSSKIVPIPASIVELRLLAGKNLIEVLPNCMCWTTLLSLIATCDASGANENGYTLLHIAAYKGELWTVRCLVDNGASLKAKTASGNTPLTKAIDTDQYEVAKFILEKIFSGKTCRASQKCCDFPNDTWKVHVTLFCGTRTTYSLLYTVVTNKSAIMLKLLLDYGASKELDADDRKKLLMKAGEIRNNEKVEGILLDWTEAVDESTQLKTTKRSATTENTKLSPNSSAYFCL